VCDKLKIINLHYMYYNARSMHVNFLCNTCQGLNNRWNRRSENQSINRWQLMPVNRLITIIDEQSMLMIFVIINFIDYQFLLIINANRSVGERIQISNICAYCKMSIHTSWIGGIPRFL